MRSKALGIRSGTVELEARLDTPPSAGRVAVLCHPHPQYGGDMDNAVVRAVGAALFDRGCAVLRFNFRGVGASTGAYGGGAAEVDDALAAVRCAREETGAACVALAGYSFGALVALHAAARGSDVCCVAAIAPPLAMMPMEGDSLPEAPVLFALGDRDPYGSLAAVDRLRAARPGRTELCLLQGADHFLFGHEQRVGEKVAEFVAGTCVR